MLRLVQISLLELCNCCPSRPLCCSQCELAVDAVHRRCEEGGTSSGPPRREEITDTMIFSPSDLVTMTCRDVDLNYATRGTVTTVA